MNTNRLDYLYHELLMRFVLPAGDFFYRSSYVKSLCYVKNELFKSEKEILDLRDNKLSDILEYACSESSYYKNLYIDHDSNVNNWLKKFPILTKEEIRTQTDLILTAPKNYLVCNSTSGSTGIQTNIYLSKDELSLVRAIQTTWWHWAGFEIGMPILQTGLSKHRTIEKRLKDFFFRTHYHFAFGLTHYNTKTALNWSKSRNPFVGGYASSLFVLSELFDSHKVNMKAVVTWGDKLFDHYRRNIERVFECKVFETYGTGEGLMLGAQKDLDYLYIMDPFYIVEILDENNDEVEDGEIGYVVVTSLIHRSMPLIRYKVGDLAIKLPRKKYPMNRDLELGLFQKIIGRETDIVDTPSGKKLTVHSFTGVFEYYSEIKQFQVHQECADELLILYIPGINFTKQKLFEIKLKLEELAEEKLNIEFIEVEKIKDSASGKPQIVVKGKRHIFD